MQLINRQTYIWVPLLVLGGALILSIAIWGILANAGVEGAFYGGGSQAPLWYFAVVGVQALTLTFPFSQAMSVTRREFFLGTFLTAALSAVILAAIFVVGGYIERWTNGWGVNGYFFYLDAAWAAGPVAAGFIYFAVAMLFFTVGFTAAAIFKRFGATVLTTTILALAALLVAVLFLIGRADAWGPVFQWIGEQGALGVAAWGVVVIAALAVGAFGTLRRATP
jgi:hypothetical protein